MPSANILEIKFITPGMAGSGIQYVKSLLTLRYFYLETWVTYLGWPVCSYNPINETCGF